LHNRQDITSEMSTPRSTQTDLYKATQNICCCVWFSSLWWYLAELAHIDMILARALSKAAKQRPIFQIRILTYEHIIREYID